MDNHSELVIRDCTIDDLDKVLEIERASFDDPYPARLFAELLHRNPRGFRVAVLDGKVVGYCATTSDSNSEAEIINSLAVLPEFRRLKIGTRLIEDAILRVRNNLPGSKKIILQVASDNISAQLLYAKFGFAKSFELKSYYGKNRDGIQMELLLC